MPRDARRAGPYPKEPARNDQHPAKSTEPLSGVTVPRSMAAVTWLTSYSRPGLGALGGGWIIASFPRPCEHVAGGTIMIDRGAEMSGGAHLAPLDELALYVSGRRCAGRNKRGYPCGSYAAPGSDYCRLHQAARKPA